MYQHVSCNLEIYSETFDRQLCLCYFFLRINMSCVCWLFVPVLCARLLCLSLCFVYRTFGGGLIFSQVKYQRKNTKQIVDACKACFFGEEIEVRVLFAADFMVNRLPSSYRKELVIDVSRQSLHNNIFQAYDHFPICSSIYVPIWWLYCQMLSLKVQLLQHFL